MTTQNYVCIFKTETRKVIMEKEKIEDSVVITEGPWAGKTLTVTLNVMEEEE